MTTAPAKPMADGKALDEMTEAAEAWARKAKLPEGGEDAWRRAFDERLGGRADQLAAKSTQPARPFEPRDWILALILWLLIGMAVFVFSVFVMQLQGTWTIVFGAFAILLAGVGIWQSWSETTSERRAAQRLEKKRAWLMDVSRKAAFDILRGRSAGGSGSGTGAGAGKGRA